MFALLTLALAAGACDESATGPSEVEGVDLQIGNALLGEEVEVVLRAEAETFEPGGRGDAGPRAPRATLPGDLGGGECRCRVPLGLIGEQSQRDQVSEAFVVE